MGLGFGMSALKLYRTIVTLAREQAIDVEITLGSCEELGGYLPPQVC